MKKIFCLLFVGLFVLASEKASAKNQSEINVDGHLKSYLNEYFGSGNFTILKEKLDLDGEKLVLAVHYVNSTRKIFNKGVGVTVEGEKVVPQIHFEKNKILDRNRKAVVDVTAFHYAYYGWKFEFPRKPVKHFNYLHMAYWRDGGSDTADSIEIDWNSKTKLSEEQDHSDEQ